MDFFAKRRLSGLIIILLVILNLSTLATIWIHHLKRPPPPAPRDYRPDNVQRLLEKELKLTKRQAQQFEELRRHHSIRSRIIRDEIYQLKEQIMDEVFSSSPDTMRVERLAAEIGDKEAELERLLFTHLSDLRSICRPEQKEKLKDLINEVLKMIRPHRPPERPREMPPHGGRR